MGSIRIRWLLITYSGLAKFMCRITERKYLKRVLCSALFLLYLLVTVKKEILANTKKKHGDAGWKWFYVTILRSGLVCMVHCSVRWNVTMHWNEFTYFSYLILQWCSNLCIIHILNWWLVLNWLAVYLEIRPQSNSKCMKGCQCKMENWA